MPNRPPRSSDSTDALHWRAEFNEYFQPVFVDIARLAPGDWTWRLEYKTMLSVVVTSKAAGRFISVKLPDNWRKLHPEDAAGEAAETVRERIQEHPAP